MSPPVQQPAPNYPSPNYPARYIGFGYPINPRRRVAESETGKSANRCTTVVNHKKTRSFWRGPTTLLRYSYVQLGLPLSHVESILTFVRTQIFAFVDYLLNSWLPACATTRRPVRKPSPSPRLLYAPCISSTMIGSVAAVKSINLFIYVFMIVSRAD